MCERSRQNGNWGNFKLGPLSTVINNREMLLQRVGTWMCSYKQCERARYVMRKEYSVVIRCTRYSPRRRCDGDARDEQIHFVPFAFVSCWAENDSGTTTLVQISLPIALFCADSFANSRIQKTTHKQWMILIWPIFRSRGKRFGRLAGGARSATLFRAPPACFIFTLSFTTRNDGFDSKPPAGTPARGGKKKAEMKAKLIMFTAENVYRVFQLWWRRCSVAQQFATWGITFNWFQYLCHCLTHWKCSKYRDSKVKSPAQIL